MVFLFAVEYPPMTVPRSLFSLRTVSVRIRKHHVAALLVLLAALSYVYSERFAPFTKTVSADVAMVVIALA